MFSASSMQLKIYIDYVAPLEDNHKTQVCDHNRQQLRHFASLKAADMLHDPKSLQHHATDELSQLTTVIQTCTNNDFEWSA